MRMIKKMWTKYNNLPEAVKASIWFVIASIVQKGIAFLTTPIFTRIMSTEDYGTFAVYQSWYSIVLIFTSLNLAGGVFNNGMTKYPEERDEFLSSLLGLTTVITTVVFFLYLVFHDYVNSVFSLDTPYILFMFLQLLFEPSFLLWSAKLRFEYKYKSLIFVIILIAILTPTTSVICVLLAHDRALARVASVVLVQVCIYFIIYILVFIRGKSFINRRYWKYAVAFNIPLIPHYLSMTILNQSDRLMIQEFCGKRYVAIYSVAYSLSMLMTIVTSAINSSFIPFIYKKMKSEEMGRIRTVSFLLTIIMAGFSILPVFLGPELIAILASSGYKEAVWIIPPVSCSVFFIFLYNFFGTIEFYYEKNKFIMLASVIGAALNVLLNYIFIPKFGFVAAGYTTLFCYILFSVAHFLFACKILRDNKIKELPFNIKKLMCVSVAVLIAMFGLTILYNYLIIRFVLFCCMVIAFCVKSKSIIQLYKNIR